MNRRELNRRLGATAMLGGLSLALAGTARAQGGPQEGRDFVRLDKPLAVTPGKVEVVEFFGYWCPHCHAFEPVLDAWARRLPAAQVNFRRMAVAFNGAQEPIQRLYFALETLGLVDSLHAKVFAAIHQSRSLAGAPKESDIAAFLKASGADSAKVLDAMKSFGVATKVRQSRQLADAYGLDGVPTLGVHGRWRTSPGMAGSHERALAVVDALIEQARKS